MRAIALALALCAPARATNFTLSVSTSGPVTPLAIVTSTPSGIVCPGSCSASFVAGTTVTLGAVWPSTQAFAGWSGQRACRSNQPGCVLLMDTNRSIGAKFNPFLAVALAGTGLGTVTASSQPATSYATGGTQQYAYQKGSVVVLTEHADSSSTFAGWLGDGGCSSASTCTVTLNGYEVVTASFTLAGPSTVTVSVVGGGSVTSSPPGIACPGTCSHSFANGATVSFTTAAAAGFRFAGWSNGGCSTNLPCSIHVNSAQQGLGGSASPSAYFYQP